MHKKDLNANNISIYVFVGYEICWKKKQLKTRWWFLLKTRKLIIKMYWILKIKKKKNTY